MPNIAKVNSIWCDGGGIVQIISPGAIAKHGGENIAGKAKPYKIAATEQRATPITNWVLT
jgi:hypothetical protein